MQSRKIASNLLWTPEGFVRHPLVTVGGDGRIERVEVCAEPDRSACTEFYAGILTPAFVDAGASGDAAAAAGAAGGNGRLSLGGGTAALMQSGASGGDSVSVVGPEPVGAAASAEAPLDRDVPVLCADSGSDLLQYRSETPGRPGPALLGEYRGGAADSTPGGRILSLGAHGGVLCGGVRPPGLRQPPVEACPGTGGWDRLLPAVPVRPLAHRRAGGHSGGRRRRLGRRAAGRRPPPQAGAAGPQGIAEKTDRTACRPVRAASRGVLPGLKIFLHSEDARHRCHAQ